MLNDDSQTSPPTLRVDILVRREDDVWVAHALQLDVVGTGDTPLDAFQEAEKACLIQVEYALDNDNLEKLFFPSSSELLRQMLTAQACGVIHLDTRLHVKRGAKKMGPGVRAPRLEIQRLKVA